MAEAGKNTSCCPSRNEGRRAGAEAAAAGRVGRGGKGQAAEGRGPEPWEVGGARVRREGGGAAGEPRTGAGVPGGWRPRRYRIGVGGAAGA